MSKRRWSLGTLTARPERASGVRGTKHITIGMLKGALRKHGGVYVLAARELGCSRENVWQRVNDNPELLAWRNEIVAEYEDVTEAGIFKKLLAADGTMLRWYAETKMKHLGYTRRIEHAGPDGAPLQMLPTIVEWRVVDAKPRPEEEDPDDD